MLISRFEELDLMVRGADAVCPLCGYNQGEERILVYHLVTAHKGIPHTPGEEMFLCQLHPEAGSMNHLEFVRHAQQESTKAANKTLGIVLESTLLKPPKCAEVNVQPGQVIAVQKRLEETRPVDARPPEIRRRFNVAMTGAVFMILIGYQLIQLRTPLNLTGAIDLVAGLGGLAGSLLYYVHPFRQRLGASIVLLASGFAWIPFVIFLFRIFVGQSLFGIYLLFLFLGPLLAMAGAAMVLAVSSPTTNILARRAFS
jgi:hypothetical protein